MSRGAMMVTQLTLWNQYTELCWIHFVCVSALKVAILNCPGGPCRLGLLKFGAPCYSPCRVLSLGFMGTCRREVTQASELVNFASGLPFWPSVRGRWLTWGGGGHLSLFPSVPDALLRAIPTGIRGRGDTGVFDTRHSKALSPSPSWQCILGETEWHGGS